MQNSVGARYHWQFQAVDQQRCCELSARYNFPIPLMQVLLSRGYDTSEKIDAFLFTDAQKMVTHAGVLCDASKAVERIMLALQNNEKILIVGDYDVDGLTATSLMMTCLMPLSGTINYFLPHRVHDGYGLSESIVKRAIASGYQLLITVDNGITAHKAVELAMAVGIDVIITDHHLPHGHLPEAYAVVNPSRHDCVYPCKELAGVGVAFKVMNLLYERLEKALPKKVYELLLLGTIADVVPLLGENRYWVRMALAQVNAQPSFALRMLKHNGGLGEKPVIDTRDIAFSIAPQLNALGRLHDPRRGVHFLLGARDSQVIEIGQQLHELNQARKELERAIVTEIKGAMQRGALPYAYEQVIVAASKQWPVGVIGLVASRVASEFNRPTVLFHITAEGIARGSARSIDGVDIFSALGELSDMVEHFGGHAAAAGVSVQEQRLPEFAQRLQNSMKQRLAGVDLTPSITIDASIQLADLHEQFMRNIAYLEPFGAGNDEPTFCVQHATVLEQPLLLKELHVKCRIQAQGAIKSVIFFNRPELHAWLIAQRDHPLDFAVQVTENYWQGNKTIELRGVDVAQHKGRL